MAEYNVIITIEIGISAPNNEKAQERAEMVADALVVDHKAIPGQPKRWLADEIGTYYFDVQEG